MSHDSIRECVRPLVRRSVGPLVMLLSRRAETSRRTTYSCIRICSIFMFSLLFPYSLFLFLFLLSPFPLNFLIFSLFPHSLSISSFSFHFLILCPFPHSPSISSFTLHFLILSAFPHSLSIVHGAWRMYHSDETRFYPQDE